MSSESLSGSRSGAASTTIQNAESVTFGGKLCLSCQTIAVGFWQAPQSDAFLDGALFSKAQIVDCFSRNIELQVWRKPLSTRPASAWRNESSPILPGTADINLSKNVSAWLYERWILWSVQQSMRIIVFVFVVSSTSWPPESMNCEHVLPTT